MCKEEKYFAQSLREVSLFLASTVRVQNLLKSNQPGVHCGGLRKKSFSEHLHSLPPNDDCNTVAVAIIIIIIISSKFVVI